MNFGKGVSNRMYFLHMYFFQGNQLWWALSCPRILSTWSSSMTAEPGTFSLLESQCISTLQTVYWFWLEPMFCPFLNILWLKHACIDLTWFALLRHPKLGDRPLFMTGAVCFIFCNFDCLKSDIFSIWKWFWCESIPSYAQFIFMIKTILKKSSLLFSKDFPLFIEWSLYVCIYVYTHT